MPRIDPVIQEKRSEIRKHRIFRLTYKIYNAESDTFEISDGVSHNYSATGLYFETKNPFQPHDQVCLSSEDQLLGNCLSEFANGVHAQIAWCKPLNTSYPPRYGAGVQYNEPIE